MKFDKAIPILYSTDVSKSIAYFVEQLKFDVGTYYFKTTVTPAGQRGKIRLFKIILCNPKKGKSDRSGFILSFKLQNSLVALINHIWIATVGQPLLKHTGK